MPEITYVSDISESEEILSKLSAPVRNWFTDTFPDFTDPQKVAIPEILGGNHLLLCSPTGSGKTLTAFLSIIDDLVRRSLEGSLTDSVQCIYISPIKALANDIQKNLIGPLTEILIHIQAKLVQGEFMTKIIDCLLHCCSNLHTFPTKRGALETLLIHRFLNKNKPIHLISFGTP